MTTARTSSPTAAPQHEPHPKASEHAWNRCTKCVDGFVTEYRLVLSFPRSPGKPPIVLSGLVESEEEGDFLGRSIRNGEDCLIEVKSGARTCSCKQPKKDDKLGSQEVRERAAVVRAADVVDRKTVSAGDRE